MPSCPDCGGIMIAVGEREKKIKVRGRWVTSSFIMLDCIDCGSGIDVPKTRE